MDGRKRPGGRIDAEDCNVRSSSTRRHQEGPVWSSGQRDRRCPFKGKKRRTGDRCKGAGRGVDDKPAHVADPGITGVKKASDGDNPRCPEPPADCSVPTSREGRALDWYQCAAENHLKG